ncbi:MAG: hypothetical protein JWQ29_1331 [Phenylobacterium sp.]|nr:hypothetical protein [Phenylobacterium sp.]
MRTVTVTVLISGLIACAGSAQAQPIPTGDIRCMLTMAALSGNKVNQPQATFGLFYFAGRIKAQNPNFNFATDLKPMAAKMSPADFQAETTRCGPMVTAVMQGMQAAQASFGGSPGAPPPAVPAKK